MSSMMYLFLTLFCLTKVVLLLSYQEVLTSCYGFADDYNFLVHGQADLVAKSHTADGRPLYALISRIAFQSLSICDLGFIRAVSLTGIALLVSGLACLMKKAGWSFTLGAFLRNPSLLNSSV